MKNKNDYTPYLLYISIALIVSLWFASNYMETRAASAPPELTFAPKHRNIKADELFTQTLRIENASEISRLTITLALDPMYVAVENVDLGEVLLNTVNISQSLEFTIQFDAEHNQLTFDIQHLEQIQASSADLFHVVLRSLKSGETDLHFVSVMAHNQQGEQVPINATQASISIQPSENTVPPVKGEFNVKVYLPMLHSQNTATP